MHDVVALGELLIDFYPAGQSAQGNTVFEASPGGAPCNVLAMLRKLGRKTAFIGKLGDDMFGRRLADTAGGLGIGTGGVVFDETIRTTLAFVSTDGVGERSFAFYRNPGADMMLRKDEVDFELIKGGRIFHFGTLSSTHPVVREATRAAAGIAGESGCLVSFDPNLRPLLWDSLDDARAQMTWGCANCDILKISDDEAEFLTGEKEPRGTAEALKKMFPEIRLIFVTCGSRGSAALCGDTYAAVPAFPVTPVDTTGAGDAFCACCLDAVLQKGPGGFDETALRETLLFAGAAAGLVITRKGALLSMPEKSEILEFLDKEGL